MLAHLIYISAAFREMPDEELQDILDVSRKFNAENQITGVLLYSRGHFMQVLEGEQETIEDLFFHHISQDRRHYGVYLIDNKPIQSREFSDWSMGFHRISSADQHHYPALARLLPSFYDPATLAASPGIAVELLSCFSQPRYQKW